MEWLSGNIVAILGTGFFGLSFLFVYLAHKNVQTVMKQDDPSERIVNLAQFFMRTAFAFMVCAGPLQFGLIWLQSYVAEKSVKVFVSVSEIDLNSETKGLYLVKRGQTLEISKQPITTEFRHEEALRLDASEVNKAVRKMSAQITELNRTVSETRAKLEILEKSPEDDQSIVLRTLEGG